MPTTLFTSMSEKNKNDAIRKLIDESTPHDHFFVMTVLSVLMATFGLLINSITVIIGSMLIAPLLSPMLGISLGVVMADGKLMYRSLWTIAKAVALAIPSAAIVSLLFSSEADVALGIQDSILNQSVSIEIFIAIAIVAGLAASFALVKSELSASLSRLFHHLLKQE